MKRLIALLLAMLLVLSLTACGGDSEEAPAVSSPAETAAQAQPESDDAPDDSAEVTPDVSDIMNGNGSTDVIWSQQNAQARLALEESARANGLTVEYGADGSTILTDEDGSLYIQAPDGSWSIKSADGEEVSVNGNWPDNEFTRLLPTPTVEVSLSSLDGSVFSAMFNTATVEQMKDYAEQLKTYGFTENANTDDQSYGDVSYFCYSAYNADGYFVEVMGSSIGCTLQLTKP